MVAVDVSKASDSVDHSSMWEALRKAESRCARRSPAAAMVRKTERVGENRHRKWRSDSNGRTRAKKNPLGSLPFHTFHQLALDQHMQERKETVWGVKLGEKTKKISSQIQHSEVPWPPGPFVGPW